MAVDLSMQVLVVDDYKTMIRIIRNLLKQLGFENVDEAEDGSAALAKMRAKQYGLVISDWNMEPMTGYELLKEVRSDDRLKETPFIMVTAESKTENVIAAKKAGVNNYIVKPFNPKELVARIRTRLRTRPGYTPDTLRIGDLLIDVPGHQVLRDQEPIGLTPLEFDLLVALAAKPQQVFSREMLLEQVWGYHYKADTRLVNVHVQRLRAKVEPDPENPVIVTTVRGVGYRAGGPA